MCLSCGCGRPYDSHPPETRHITAIELEQAARASGISLEQAAQNILKGVIQLRGAPPEPPSLVRPTLLVDIDGVLAFLTELAVTALNARFGTELVVSEVPFYWIEDHLPPDQGRWLVDLFEQPITYANLAPDYAGIAAVTALHDADYHVIVSSDRPPTARHITEQWLDKWRVPYDELVLKGPGGKESIASQHGPDDPLILFDDDPRKQLTVPRPGVELWSPQRPWTPRRVVPDGVWVFERWDDVLERLGVSPEVPIPQFSREAGPGTEPAG
jgi:5'(3')-deoxyribonucleotidase